MLGTMKLGLSTSIFEQVAQFVSVRAVVHDPPLILATPMTALEPGPSFATAYRFLCFGLPQLLLSLEKNIFCE